MADRLVVMHEGRVQQIGTPEAVHSRPANPFVARFIGGSNLVRGRMEAPVRCRAMAAAIALAHRHAPAMPRRPGAAARQRAPGASGRRLRRGRGGTPHLARRGDGARRAHLARTSTLLARGPGLGPDATPRHTAGTRVALRWGPDGRRCSMQAGHAIDADIRESSHADHLSRRPSGGAALLATPAIIRPGRGRAVRRRHLGRRLWRLLRENIDDPLLKPAGIEVVQDVGDESPRMTKLYAQKKLPRGSVDIACVGALNGYRVTEAELVEELDEKKVPNLKHVQSKTFGCQPSCRTSIARRCWCTIPIRERAAADVERSARSEMEGQDRHGRHHRIVDIAGGEPAREWHDHRLREGKGAHDRRSAPTACGFTQRPTISRRRSSRARSRSA